MGKTDITKPQQNTDCVQNYWDVQHITYEIQGPVLPMLLRHVAKILANGSTAFFESCDATGWNSCDMSQKR